MKQSVLKYNTSDIYMIHSCLSLLTHTGCTASRRKVHGKYVAGFLCVNVGPIRFREPKPTGSFFCGSLNKYSQSLVVPNDVNLKKITGILKFVR